MDQLHLLLLLSFSMLIGSFFSGTVPMAFKMSDSKSRLLALLGSGILVGTALAIIIPEGIDSLYGQSGNPPPPISTNQDLKSPEPVGGSNNDEPPIQEPVKTWIIGSSLVAGFVLMLLVDQFSIYQNHNQTNDNNRSRSQDHEYILANQEDDFEVEESKSSNGVQFGNSSEIKPIREIDKHRSVVSMRAIERENHSNDPQRISPNNRPSNGRTTKVTPTLGLVIHASADGIALGAAATTSHRDVEMIIFLAIMLHKAPAAFSLVVFLLHRGLSHATVRRHLLAFSLSAPLAALLTYFGLSQSGKEALRRNNATGIAMLFSAGTFLYVATVHVLPELVNNKLLTPRELMFLVGGTFLPLLLAQTI